MEKVKKLMEPYDLERVSLQEACDDEKFLKLEPTP